MKSASFFSLLVAMLIIWLPQRGFAQVFVGDLFLETQTEVDTFPYTEVTGHLSIGGASVDSLKNLNGLSGLKRIGMDLYISGSSNHLLSISGLDSLASIGGNIRVLNAPVLQSIDGFESLDSVGGQIRIENCDRLKSISGFSNTSYVGEWIRFRFNDSLQTISGFDQLNNAQALGFQNLPLLDSLGGFQHLDSLAQELFVINTGLAHISALHELEWIGSDFVFNGNPRVLNLDPLNTLTYIGGDFNLIYCDSIKQFDSLRHVEEIGGEIYVNFNDSLESLDGLHGLSTIKAGIKLYGQNSKLDDLAFFQDIHRVDGNLELGEFPGLTTLDNLVQLDSIVGALHLYDITLDNLSGLDSLRYCEVMRFIGLHTPKLDYFPMLDTLFSLEVVNCPIIKRIEGYSSLGSVGSFIRLKNNLALVAIDGFPSLTKIAGTLSIEENPSLVEIAGFTTLDSVEAGISIRNNGSLFGVPAFANLTYVGKTPPLNFFNVVVSGNTQLLSLCGLSLFAAVNNVNLNVANITLSYSSNAPGVSLADAIGNGPCESGKFPVLGQVISDQNANCQVEPTEPGLENWLIKSNPGNYYSITDADGQFEIGMDTTGYSLELIPPYSIQQYLNSPVLCDTFKNVNVALGNIPAEVDPWLVSVPQCPQIQISFSNLIFRRCFTRDITLHCQNLGNANADSLQIMVRLPDLVNVLGASTPFQYSQDSSTLVFDVGSLMPYTSQSITIITEVVCTDVEHLGLEQCIEAWAESPSFCGAMNTNPNGGSIALQNRCVGDSLVELEARNLWKFPVTDSLAYTIYRDTTIIELGNILLDTANSAIFSFPAGQSTYRLEVMQDTSHDYPGLLATALEGCTDSLWGYTSRGMISKFPEPRSRSHPAYEVRCRPIIGAYDPNDKQVQPTGLGPQSLTFPGTRLTYRIRFQNTGTDTAFNIRVIDTMSVFLDVSTLEVASSSHDYQLWITGDSVPILTFYFQNIQLPDSNTNEPLSNGYIEFEINPYDGVPLGLGIENFADIYFDFNPPIRTDTAITTLGIYTPDQNLQPGQLTLVNIPPAVPMGLAVPDTSPTIAQISWQDQATDEFGFILYKSEGDTLSFAVLDTLPANTSSYVDSALFIGSNSYYRIQSYGMGGASGFSNLDSTYRPVPTPPTPQILEIVDSVYYEALVKWNDSTSYDSAYVVQRSLDSLVFVSLDTLGASVTEYLDQGLLLDQDYWYRVIAYNQSGASDPSLAVKFRQNTPLPTPPQNVSLHDSLPLIAYLTWDAGGVFDETYLIQRSLDNTTFAALDTISAPNASYTDTLLAFETHYWYRVITENVSGQSLPGDTVHFYQGVPIPPSPQIAEIVDSVYFEALVKWNDSTDYELAYVVQRSFDSLVFISLDTLGVSVTQYLDQGLSLDQDYWYRIIAMNDSGASEPSEAVKFRQSPPFPEAPLSLQATLLPDLEAQLEWEDNQWESGYIIEERSLDSLFVPIDTLPANQESYLIQQDSFNLSYQYRVIAFNSSGVSEPSNVVEVNHILLPAEAPDSLQILMVEDGIPTLTWIDRAESEEGFKLERSEENQPFATIQTLPANSTMATDSTIESGRIYVYRVLAFNAVGDSDPSNEVEYQITSVESDLMDLDQLSLYPVPFDQDLWIINGGEPMLVEVLVMNSQGQTVKFIEEVLLTERLHLSLVTLPDGVYHVRVLEEFGQKSWIVANVSFGFYSTDFRQKLDSGFII